jgi:uncharacterized protein YegL
MSVSTDSAIDLGLTCLPTYLVIDASSSMIQHQDVLNATLDRLHRSLAMNPRVSEFAHVCLIAFSTDPHLVIPLSEMDQVPVMPQVVCAGSTEYGKAFDLVRQCIDHDVPALRGAGWQVLRPAVFFLTDGAPTDPDWKARFDALVDPGWSRRPHVISYGFGGANPEVLRRVHTKLAFLADGSDSEAALSEALTSLLNTLISSSERGQLTLPAHTPGFVTLDREYVG